MNSVMFNKTYPLCILFILGLAAFPNYVNAVPGQGTLYGTSPDQLIIVNTNNGTGSVVGPNSAMIGFPGLAIDTSSETSYAGCGGGCQQIYNFNLNNGMATLLGSTNGIDVVSGMDFNSEGVLYGTLNAVGDGGTGGDHLGIVNTNTGEVTVIGPFGSCGSESCTIDGIEAIAFDAGGVLWGSLRFSPVGSGTPGLYTINPNTGEATFVAPIVDSEAQPIQRGGVVSLQFACDGTLYGGTAPDGESPGGFLVTINSQTGVYSFVGAVSATSGASLGGLAFDTDCSGGPPETVVIVPTLTEWGLIAMICILAVGGFIVIRRKGTVS